MKIDGSGGVGSPGVQQGLTAQTMSIAVEQALEQSRVGAWKGIPLGSAPEVESLAAVELEEVFAFIMEDQTQVDYPKRTAFVDGSAGEFYLKVEGNTGDLGGPPAFWFGPMTLDLIPD